MKKFNILFAIASLLIFAQGAWAQENIPHFTEVKDDESGDVLQNGTPDKPFLITSVQDLNFLAEDVNNHYDHEGEYFLQTVDITYGKDDEFTPIGIGDEENGGTPFKGYFDGGNHTISGITFNGLEDEGDGVGIGLFGYIYYPAVIKNVKLENCSFTGNWEVGAIVGVSGGNGEGYVIDNCTLGSLGSGVTIKGVSTTVEGETMPAAYIGGIIGYAHCITVSNCYSEATVSGGDFVGAIAGYLLGSSGNEAYIENCYSSKAEKAVGGRGKEDEFAPSDATDGILKITLFADDSDEIKNLTRIKNYHNLACDVTMKGLTFNKSGKWNSVCLPFNITKDQLAEEACPFYGATIMSYEYANSPFDYGTLTMNFTQAEKIDNKNPYFVKWESGSDVTDPVFQGVKVVYNGMGMSHETVDADIAYVYHKPQPIEASKAILYLGDDNKLYFPKEAMTINPFHAYFKLQNGIKACSSNGNVNGDEDVTVADITSLVNIVKNPASQPEKAGVADVNDDNNVTVDDVAALANIILGKDIEGAMRAIKTDDAIGTSYGFGGSSKKPARARKM